MQLLSVAEVAAALGVCRATVRTLIHQGKLDRVWVGASMRVPIESLRAFVATGKGL